MSSAPSKAAAAASASTHPSEDFDSPCDSASLTPSDEDFLAPDDTLLPDSGWPFEDDSVLQGLSKADALVVLAGAGSAATPAVLAGLSAAPTDHDCQPLADKVANPCFAWTDDALFRVHERVSGDKTTAIVEFLTLFGARTETRMTLRTLYEIARHAKDTPTRLVFVLKSRPGVPPVHERGVVAMRDILAVLSGAMGTEDVDHGVLFSSDYTALQAACAGGEGLECLRAFWRCAKGAQIGFVDSAAEGGLSVFEQSVPEVQLPEADAVREAARKLFPAEVGNEEWVGCLPGVDDEGVMEVPRWREWAAEPFAHDASAPAYSVIVLGGPGAGKTSIFRALVSGAGGSVADGACDVVVDGVRYIDTEALSGRDDASAAPGCDSVSQALASASGPTKLVFVCRVARACVRDGDAAAMRFVLHALESGHVDTGGRFCVIANGCSETEQGFVSATRQWGEQLGETLTRQGDALGAGGDVGVELLQKSAPVHYTTTGAVAGGVFGAGEIARLRRFMEWAPVVRIPSISSRWVEPQDVRSGAER